MALLKKIKGSTLMETLVASVLIVVIFMITSMILNNMFSNRIESNTRQIEAHLNELEYLYQSDKLIIPYKDTMDGWSVSIDRFIENEQSKVEFEAIRKETEQHITRVRIEN